MRNVLFYLHLNFRQLFFFYHLRIDNPYVSFTFHVIFERQMVEIQIGLECVGWDANEVWSIFSQNLYSQREL